PFVIGVLGADPFGSHLDDVVRGETVNGRPLVIRRVGRIEEAVGCQILFISQSEAARVRSIVEALASASMLTVRDAEGSAQGGVMVRLVTDKSRVRLRINVEAARAAGLTISSKLLRAAEIVAGR